MKFGTKPKGVRYVTLLMIVVGIFFLIPAFLYIAEGGPMIALLPFVLAVISFLAAIGLYMTKKIAWIVAIILGLAGGLIFMADYVNVNIESIIGSIVCIILLVILVLERKYYVNE